MIINKNISGSEMIAAPEDRIDTVTAPELEAALQDMPADIEKLIIDFEKVTYISSAGLRVLLRAEKLMKDSGKSMVLRHVGEAIEEIFELTGFSDILTIEK